MTVETDAMTAKTDAMTAVTDVATVGILEIPENHGRGRSQVGYN
jgi:hypothetical protein